MCFLPTTFPNAPAPRPRSPILFDQSLTVKFLVGAIENLAVKMFVRQRRGCMDE